MYLPNQFYQVFLIRIVKLEVYNLCNLIPAIQVSTGSVKRKVLSLDEIFEIQQKLSVVV